MPRSVTIWSGVALAAAFASAAVAADPMGPGGPPGPGPGAPPPGAPMLHLKQLSPPSPQERAAKLKAILQLSPAQDAAVDAFVVATAPPDLEDLPEPDRQKAEAMTTPQRLDRMAEMHKQIESRMAKVEAATRTFYSALTPSQKAAFDALPPPAVMGFAGPPPGGPPMGRAGVRP